MMSNENNRVEEVEIGEMKKILKLYDSEAGLERANLTALAAFDKQSNKYLVKIVDEVRAVNYVLKLRRTQMGLRVMNLNTAARNIHKLGFMSFTVLMDKT